MHETLRRRILRKLETLPETQLYQVLDYIEFLESRYTAEPAPDASGLQRWAERLEDGLRKRTLNPSTLREAFQLLAMADRALSSVQEVGRQFVDELQWEEGEGVRSAGSSSAGPGSRRQPPSGGAVGGTGYSRSTTDPASDPPGEEGAGEPGRAAHPPGKGSGGAGEGVSADAPGRDRAPSSNSESSPTEPSPDPSGREG